MRTAFELARPTSNYGSVRSDRRSLSAEDDHGQGVCRAAFAAIDAIVANGA